MVKNNAKLLAVLSALASGSMMGRDTLSVSAASSSALATSSDARGAATRSNAQSTVSSDYSRSIAEQVCRKILGNSNID